MDDEVRIDRRAWIAAMVCTVSALAVRWWVLRDLHADDPLLRVGTLDDREYVEMARRIAVGEQGGWFLAPLHPWMGSVVFGREVDVRGLSWVNAVVGALTSGTCALAAAALVRDSVRRTAAAWCAGLLHALLGVFVFHDVVPGQEPAIGLCTAAAVLVGARLADEPRPGLAVTLGLLVGVAAMGRGTALALALCALPALLVHRGRWLRSAGLVALGLLVVLVPATIRNARVDDSWSPFPWTGGLNLYLANGPDARAEVAMTTSEVPNDPVSLRRWGREAVRFPDGSGGGSEISRRWVRRTWESLDGTVVPHVLRKAVLVLAPDRRGSNHHAGVESEFAAWLGVVPTSGWWLLAVGIGCWVWRRREDRRLDVAAWAVGATVLGLLVFFPIGRYRVPALVACVSLAGATLPCVRVAWTRDRRRLLAGAVTAVALGALGHVPVARATEAGARVNVAEAIGDWRNAAPAVERQLVLALEADPEFAGALLMLADLRMFQGRPQEALDLYVRAAQRERTYVSAQAKGLRALLTLGRAPDAWRAARGLVDIAPHDPLVLAHAALAAHAVGDAAAARRLLARARAAQDGRYEHPAVREVEALLGR